METSKQAPLLRELKNYLIHLKDLGYTDIPLEADLFEALPQFLEELNKLNTIQK
jgi:hypothetical protein